jgi:hypothetical protein
MSSAFEFSVDFELTGYPVTLANLNRIGIVRMSRVDDLVSFVSPQLSRAG